MYTKQGIDVYVKAKLYELRDRVQKLNNKKIAIITDDSGNPANESYIRNKTKLTKFVGLDCEIIKTSSFNNLKAVVNSLIDNNIPYIIQLPHKCQDQPGFNDLFVDQLDIDGLSDSNLGSFLVQQEEFMNI